MAFLVSTMDQITLALTFQILRFRFYIANKIVDHSRKILTVEFYCFNEITKKWKRNVIKEIRRERLRLILPRYFIIKVSDHSEFNVLLFLAERMYLCMHKHINHYCVNLKGFNFSCLHKNYK